VQKEFVSLLDTGGGARGDDQIDIGGSGGEASPLSQQSDRFHLLAARFLDSGKHVARFAAGRQRDEDIARFAECPNLPRKDILKAVVIPDRGQKSTIPA